MAGTKDRSPNGVFISPEIEAALVLLYNGGESLLSLERHFNKDRGTIRHHLIRLGVYLKRRNIKNHLPRSHPAFTVAPEPVTKPPHKYASIIFVRPSMGRSYAELRLEAHDRNVKRHGRDLSYSNKCGFWDEKTTKALRHKISKKEARRRFMSPEPV